MVKFALFDLLHYLLVQYLKNIISIKSQLLSEFKLRIIYKGQDQK
jgi:hypothetical protein